MLVVQALKMARGVRHFYVLQHAIPIFYGCDGKEIAPHLQPCPVLQQVHLSYLLPRSHRSLRGHSEPASPVHVVLSIQNPGTPGPCLPCAFSPPALSCPAPPASPYRLLLAILKTIVTALHWTFSEISLSCCIQASRSVQQLQVGSNVLLVQVDELEGVMVPIVKGS